MVSIRSMNREIPCLEPTKKKYDTEEEAKKRLDEILTRRAIDEEYRISHTEKSEVPCRVYFCDCGYYHLTARVDTSAISEAYVTPTIAKEKWPDSMRPSKPKSRRPKPPLIVKDDDNGNENENEYDI